MILAYIVRHGSTDMSPAPEWQLQIPLNELGTAQAVTAGEWIKRNVTQKKLPTWGISSDLKRVEQTIAICAKILNFEVVKPMPDLRAVDNGEDPDKFEERNKRAFAAILAVSKMKKRIPLIACHRSNTVYLARQFGNVLQSVDYREMSAVSEGGVLELSTQRGLMPLYQATDINPRANFNGKDGTTISGFVTDDINHMPRKCGNCKWMDTNHCDHPVVTADDEVGLMFGRKRNAKGKWIVEPSDCCDNFQHILRDIGGGA